MPSSNLDKSFAARTHRLQLTNGATLLMLENHASPQVSLAGYLRTGGIFNPPGKDLLADLTAAMLNKGTQRHTKLELAERLESVGARCGFDAGRFTTHFGGRCLTRDLPMLVATIAEELREPGFPASELEKLKRQFVTSLKEELDDTGTRAYDRFTQLVFAEDHPLHRYPTERSIRELESITVADVENFYRQHYGAAGMVLALVGDIEPAATHALLETHLGDWQGAARRAFAFAPAALGTPAQREVVYLKDKPNCQVFLGHTSGLQRKSADYYAAMLANSALGESTLSSRLGLKVRDEMGLTYGITSNFSEVGFADSPFVIGVTVAPQNIQPAIETTLEIVTHYLRDGITSAELADEQSSTVGNFKLGLATNAGIASALARAEVYDFGQDYLDRFPALIRAVTKEQVDAAMRKYIHPHRTTTVIAGSYTE